MAVNLDPTNPYQLEQDSQTMAMHSLVNSFDSNPDDAARTMQLSQATGVNPVAIDQDQENFERQLKATVSSHIVGNNPFLQNYINSTPMAAKVSHDDLAGLDYFSSLAVQKGEDHLAKNVFNAFTNAFEGKSQEYQEFSDWIDKNVSNMYSRLIYKGAGAAAQLGLSAGQGGLQAVATTVGEIYKGFGGNESEAARLVRDLIPMMQLAVPEVAPEVMASKSWQHLSAYAEKGKLPPPGSNPLSDEIYKENAKNDVKELQDQLKAAVKTQTRERSPDLFKLYAELHGLKDDIGISSEAVRALYGDKVPATDDGLLGWVPHLQEQLLATEATGGDIHVPVSDYLARIEPEVAKQLEDFIRPKKDGMNLAEAKEPSTSVETEPVVPTSPNEEALQAVRQSAGLEPKPEPPRLESTTEHYNITDPVYADKEGTNETFQLSRDSEGKPDTFISSGGRVTKIPPAYKELSPEEALLKIFGIEAKDGLPASKVTKVESKTVPPVDTSQPFAKAAAMGITEKEYVKYQQLIEKKATEDQAWLQQKLEEEERRRTSVEMKDRKIQLRPEVVRDINDRPEIDLYESLSEGRFKLDPSSLTDVQRNAIPKKWQAAKGVHAEDVGKLYDMEGDEAINGLVDHINSIEVSGMQPMAYKRRLIEAELDTRASALIRKLSMDEIMDHVLSETQIEMLHEEALSAASKAGAAFPISKDEYLDGIHAKFNELRVRDVSSDRFITDAGKAGRETEKALLKGDAAEAFRQKQLQYNNVIFAKRAKEIEKAQERFDKTAKTFKAREVAGVDQEYTNWVHDLLVRMSQPINRSIQDLKDTIERKAGDTGATTLKDFVEFKNNQLRELPVADFLQDPNFRKPVEELTVPEFREMTDSIKSLVKNGRDEAKLNKGAESATLAELKGKMIETLERFKQKLYDLETGKREGVAGMALPKLARSFGINHLQLETVLNRLDKFDPRGIWNQYLFRPMSEAANHEARMERDFAKKLGAIKDDADLSEKIPNPPFANPFSGVFPETMTRKGLRTIILNMGNEGNFNKLVAGFFRATEDEKELRQEEYANYKAQVAAWVHQHATKADWDWAQQIWDTFKDLNEQSKVMYESLSGIAPEGIKIKPVQTPHGEYAGGYYPLIRHEVFGEDPKFQKSDLEGQGYIRATTAAGYTKQRTGAIYPLSLNLDRMPGVMKQIIHDIAFRPAVINASKIIHDKEIRNALKKHLGEEYEAMFHPWLKDAANYTNFAYEKEWAAAASWSDFMRQNVVTTLVGLNPSTFLKHTPTALISSMAEVGPSNFAKAFTRILGVNDETGMRNWDFALKNSEELQRRSRNWVETMGGGMRYLEGEHGTLAAWRDTVTQLASKPVAFGDMMSAVPTWMAAYEKDYRANGVHGDAVFAADKAVRQAHGSTAVTSKSAVARAPSLKWFTGFFTFFNDLLNRQVETLWRAGEALDLAKEGKRAEALAQGTKVVGRVMAYVIAPAIIEELVTPQISDSHESWGKKAVKGLAFTLSSSWVGVRDLVSGVLNGRDPGAGLLSTLYKSGSDTIRDLTAKHPKPGNIIKHGTQLTGVLTGMTPAQLGRTAEFGYGVNTGLERPKGPWGWMVGARYGTLKHHSPTFDKWLRNRE